MLKYAPTAAEIEEGVAFYGRAGNALMKSFKRLGIDPLVVYGTLCVKCPTAEPDLAGRRSASPGSPRRSRSCSRGSSSSWAKALTVLNRLDLPLAEPISGEPGEIQRLTPTIEALYVPDIDDSLDEEGAKQRFWSAFRKLGEWYADLPPY